MGKLALVSQPTMLFHSRPVSNPRGLIHQRDVYVCNRPATWGAAASCAEAAQRMG